MRRRVQAAVDRRFAQRRVEATRLLREYLEQVREGHAEPEDIGEAVAVALGDPEAEIVFRLPESDAYADDTGRLLDGLPDDGRGRAVIGRDDRELGVLLHSVDPPPEPDLLRAVQDEAAVPVELARLRVELRLQLAEVESSRARIAQAGYAERRRIERDLHDGAQQRLVTLGIVLRRLQRSLPDEARVLVPALDAAVNEVAGRSPTCARSPPGCARRASTRGSRPPSPTWPAAPRCPWRSRPPPGAPRRRWRRPPTSSPARRSRTPSSTARPAAS